LCIFRTEYKTRDTANSNSFVQFKPLRLRESEKNPSNKKLKEEKSEKLQASQF
jgi:hypothetical protein